VELAAVDLLARVMAARTTRFRGLDALAIDDGSRRRLRSARECARSANQRFVEEIERATVAQAVKVMLPGRCCRKAPEAFKLRGSGG
jgi:hypothetical protein